ncbi:MAG: hypothetical protein MJ227_00545 [Bacilli bacterium]|nr:hypothetical protein [Bacilli bacterium]
MVMKRFLLTTLGMTFCLISCNKNSNNKTIYTLTNYDTNYNCMINITYAESEIMLSQHSNFVLFLGKQNCSICMSVETDINAQIKQNNVLVYKYYVIDENDPIFTLLNLSTAPNLIIINNGEIVRNLQGFDIENRNNITRLFNDYTCTYEASTLFTKSSLESYMKTHNKFFVFTYTIGDTYSYSFYKKIIPYLSTKKNTLIIDYIKLQNRKELYTYLDIEKYVTNYLAFVVENGLSKNIVQYISEPEAFSQLISDYYS